MATRPRATARAQGGRPGRYCDCGERKHGFEVACSRCRWLDGGGGSLAPLVVAELRAMGGRATAQDIAGRLSIKYQNVQQSLEGLRRDGRVAKRMEEAEAGHVWSTGIARISNRAVYYLTGG
jgi:hypothetical protein